MNDSPTLLNVLAFAGSLRKGSYNKSLIRAAKELSPGHLGLEIFDIADIPLYNADVESNGDPGPVSAFKEAIGSADGLLIATPEYNHGTSGVTKNAIDWASRPPQDSPLNKKPVGIMGASPGATGSARGQSQLRQAFGFTNSYCMPQPEILVYRAAGKFDDEGKLTDDKTRDFLEKYLESFYDWIKLFRGE
ncbi:MAG: NADPH-dependent FMN reductase [Balneolaceae bacterium]